MVRNDCRRRWTFQFFSSALATQRPWDLKPYPANQTKPNKTKQNQTKPNKTKQMKIAILTFCVGGDYVRAMEPGLASKRAYAAKHGYTFLSGGEDVWDRSRPAAWSKLLFILKHLDDYDYIFWSDADAIITNPALSLESHVLPLLPAEKDMLWARDACGNLNSGHLLIRGRSAWVRDFLQRVYAQTEFIYHQWWENAAMIAVVRDSAADRAKIETCEDHWLFNAYVFGAEGARSAARLYKPGDFLIHFAGVYSIWNIYRMMRYVDRQVQCGEPVDPDLLDRWRNAPPANKAAADESLTAIGIV
jgi:hypothetical protein